MDDYLLKDDTDGPIIHRRERWTRGATLVVSHLAACALGAAVLFCAWPAAKPTTVSLHEVDCTSPPPPYTRPPLPAFPPARRFPPSPPNGKVPKTDDVRDIAIVVFTRHGERPVDKDDPHLTKEGFVRAEYMNKCIDTKPTVALPLGAPTRMLASLRDDSKRPVETLGPIADKLGVKLETDDMMNIYAANEIIPTLQPNDQLLISWQHWFMPRMISALCKLAHAALSSSNSSMHSSANTVALTALAVATIAHCVCARQIRRRRGCSGASPTRATRPSGASRRTRARRMAATATISSGSSCSRAQRACQRRRGRRSALARCIWALAARRTARAWRASHPSTTACTDVAGAQRHTRVHRRRHACSRCANCIYLSRAGGRPVAWVCNGSFEWLDVQAQASTKQSAC